MHSLYEAHMNVVYKILQYLKETLGKGLHFGKHDQFKIEAFTDVNWVGSIEDRRSNLATVHLCLEISSHGEVKTKMW